MRYSKQRELILNTVLKNKIHPTADDVYNLLRDEYPGLSLGTVYRNLNFLSEHNMLKKISVPNGSDCFDGTLTNHQHLVCVRCGKVFDISIPEISKIENDVYNRTGFRINTSSLAFEGICHECEKK
ncbi:Fur family transcriptional regulator [Porcipelethomonas sp.]|uniref:Fur family transcriptional regulator n=1 Tax=Porcipelethomonas sp. TaxID=2981675 RepID=UPI003EF13DC7